MKPQTVFISSTGKDLDKYRKALIRSIDKAAAFNAICSERFGADPNGAVALCRTRVEGCDLFVGLIGHYRGWEPGTDGATPTDRSITELEYDWASERRMDRYMYVLPESAQAQLDALDDVEMAPEAAARQSAFRTRVRGANDHIHDINFYEGDVPSPADFAADVMSAFTNRLYEALLAQARTSAPLASSQDITERGPETALAELASDPTLDSALLNPGTFNLATLEQAVAARAEARSASGEADITSGQMKLKAAGADFVRLGDLHRPIDIVKAHGHYRRAAEIDPSNGVSLFWVCKTGLETVGNLQSVMDIVGPALEALDDSDDPDGAFWAHIGFGDVSLALG
ncbi:MAG: DUF4062 domain-containing protein, partial [Pseudomonadota bacterium]